VWSDFDKISHTGADWHVDCGDMVEIETRCWIPIWRTFGRIQWHVTQIHLPHCSVLPLGEFNVMISELRVTLQGAAARRIQRHVISEPSITLQGAATWWIYCHDSRATSHCRVQTELVSVKFPGVSRYDEQIKRLHFGRNWHKSKGEGYTRELLNPSQSVLPRCPTSAGATTGIPYTFSTVKNSCLKFAVVTLHALLTRNLFATAKFLVVFLLQFHSSFNFLHLLYISCVAFAAVHWQFMCVVTASCWLFF